MSVKRIKLVQPRVKLKLFLQHLPLTLMHMLRRSKIIRVYDTEGFQCLQLTQCRGTSNPEPEKCRLSRYFKLMFNVL